MNYSAVIDEIFNQFTGPKFLIKLWDGSERSYGTGDHNIFTLTISDERTAKRLLAEGSLGFGESYMEGKIQITGDLEGYLRMRHQFKRVKRSFRLILATFLASRSIPKDRKEQISYHYDLGNDFFQMLLDRETMSYSAGRYEREYEDLGTAQENKLKFISDWMNLPAGSSVLDLGFGWGGFARFAVKKKNWQITGYTLSNAQLDYCNKLIKTNHLGNFVSFEFRDFIDNLPERQFDAITMIESIEHVGQKRLAQFFINLHKRLKPSGLLVLQLTGRYKPHRVDRWTLKYVFPGGYLPAKEELISAAKNAGFDLEEFRDDTPDYIRTMTEWIENLEGHREDIENKFGLSFYRLWELWMHGAKVNFELGSMNLFRLRLKRSE